MSALYPRLFTPLALGPLTLRNRIVMLPHGTSMVAAGAPTDDDIAYYERRSDGVGLIVTGAAVTSPDSTRRGRKLVESWSEAAAPMLARRAAAVRAKGATIIGQIVHLGREGIGMETDHPLIAPSPIRSPRDLQAPRAMDESDIRRVIADFAASAALLQRTGHDGVELHGAHGYLIAQFLSAATNRRDDAWGGDADRRLRFLTAIIDAIRAACGATFVIGLRLSADEDTADGMTVADTQRIVERLAAHHPVDYLSVTLGMRGAYVRDATTPAAPAARAAGLLRAASGFVTIVGQRFTEPGRAEAALAAGQADAVGFARAFIADPDWVAHAAADRPQRIRPCIGLNQDCRAFAPHLHCAVNPAAGRERDARMDDRLRAPARLRVAVIGAGPAGLEAARVAAARGHLVSLYEASDTIGGQFLYAAALPGRADLARIVDHLRAEAGRLGVTIRTHHPITSPADLATPADRVIVATGARARPLDDDPVSPASRSCFDILAAGTPSPTGGGNALVLDDGTGFWWTYGVADLLRAAGWRVTIATPAAAIAGAIPTESLPPLLARLGRGETRYRPLTTAVAGDDDMATLIDLASGAEETVACDLFVVQTGRAACSIDLHPFTAAGLHATVIGDALAPRRISNALSEARLAGSAL